jgi:hypothetical protein
LKPGKKCIIEDCPFQLREIAAAEEKANKGNKT